MPRNFLQYFVGAVIFYTFFGKINLYNAILGGIAFISFYQFTYAFNDLIDYKSDIKNKNIMKKKLALNYPLHASIVKTNELMIVSTAFLILGLLLSIFVSINFVFAQILLILLTLTHSNPFLKLKTMNLLLYGNMIFIQFMKFSLGWFSQTIAIETFPYWLFIMLASIYVWGYRYYKSHFLQQLKSYNTADIMIVFVFIISFIVSVVSYNLPFPLIFSMLICSSIVLYYFERLKNLKEKMQTGITLIEIFYLIVIFSFISIRLFPAIYEFNYSLNSMLTDGINIIKILISGAYPMLNK